MHDLSFEAFTGSSARTARLVSLDGSGLPSVSIGRGASAVVTTTRTTIPIDPADVGRDVLIVLDADRPQAPVIVGLLREAGAPQPRTVTVEGEGETLTVSAEKSLRLVCGQASIRLSQSGKIEIRGTHIVSRSIGPNKIKGGSVQLN